MGDIDPIFGHYAIGLVAHKRTPFGLASYKREDTPFLSCPHDLPNSARSSLRYKV